MRITPISTGTVRLKEAFLHARTGVRRQLDLLLPGDWSGPLPIHCWVVEHDGRTLLVDTGEHVGVKDMPFARFEVGPQDELPAALAAAGFALDAVDETVLTHLHGDHMDGAPFVAGRPVHVHARELEYMRSRAGRLVATIARQPLPDVPLTTFTLDDGPLGAFDRSHRLSADGRIVVVPTPGHTVGHVSVLCVDDDGRHVLLAGDATDTLEQLLARRHDAVGPDPAVAVATIDTILAHGRAHPTVYLPSHDPESATRLTAGETLPS